MKVGHCLRYMASLRSNTPWNMIAALDRQMSHSAYARTDAAIYYVLPDHRTQARVACETTFTRIRQ